MTYIILNFNLTILLFGRYIGQHAVFAEHSNYIDVGNQVFTRLWQECFALAFLLAYDVCALPTVFVYVESSD